jgi:hypothetical protein
MAPDRTFRWGGTIVIGLIFGLVLGFAVDLPAGIAAGSGTAVAWFAAARVHSGRRQR